MDIWWYVAVGAVVGALAFALRLAVLEFPWCRVRTVHRTVVLPWPREAVWRAWFADKRLLAGAPSFEAARIGDVIDVVVAGGEERDEACRQRLRVIDCRPGETFWTQHLVSTGHVESGGSEALLLADDPVGTRVTLVVVTTTPTLQRAHDIGSDLLVSLVRLEYDLDAEPRTGVDRALAGRRS